MDKAEAVNNSMTESMQILQQAVPLIKNLLHFKDGEIISVEHENNKACIHLDMKCGIDYLAHFKREDYTRGIAWRAQPIIGSPWDTFTIRKSRESGAVTEYEKRKIAIENNGLYPHYTVHAYYDKITKELLSLGITTTKEVIDCISKGHFKTLITGKNQIGQAEAYIVKWSDMAEQKYNIITWHKE